MADRTHSEDMLLASAYMVDSGALIAIVSAIAVAITPPWIDGFGVGFGFFMAFGLAVLLLIFGSLYLALGSVFVLGEYIFKNAGGEIKS